MFPKGKHVVDRCFRLLFFRQAISILGTGLICRLRFNFSIFANYNVLTSHDYTAHAGSGGLQYLR